MYPYFQQLPIYKMLTIHITFDNVARVNVVIRTAAHADREQCTASAVLVVRKLHFTKLFRNLCVIRTAENASTYISSVSEIMLTGIQFSLGADTGVITADVFART